MEFNTPPPPLQDLEKKMLENYHFLMTGLLPFVPTLQQVSSLHGVTAVFSRYNNNTFNYVLHARFTPQDVHDKLRQTIAFYQEKNLPFAWYVSALDTPPTLFLLLKEAGLLHKETNVAMCLDIHSLAYKNESPLRFHRALDGKALEDFDEVNRSVGEISHWEPLFQSFPSAVLNEDFPIEYHVGYKDQEPVTIGMVVLHAGVAGIYYMGTKPSEQRRGYAKSMMYHLFDRAKRRGYTLMTLQATAEGQYLYEKIGFQAFSYVQEYNWNPTDGG